jgi:hypothetical protein
MRRIVGGVVELSLERSVGSDAQWRKSASVTSAAKEREMAMGKDRRRIPSRGPRGVELREDHTVRYAR